MSYLGADAVVAVAARRFYQNKCATGTGGRLRDVTPVPKLWLRLAALHRVLAPHV